MSAFDGAALVTGAASGIGLATARRLAREGVEALALLDRDGEALKEVAAELPVPTVLYQLDVSDEDAVTDAIGSFSAAYRLRYAVNAAGLGNRTGLIADLSADTWDQLFNVNSRGLFLCLKHELRAMKATGGSIVNVGSSLGLLKQEPGNSAYSASKAAVAVLSQTAALEAAPDGIRVNIVAPGGTRTNMTDAIPPDRRARLEAKHPLGRFAEADEIAAGITFLLGEDGSFTTGAVLAVDGGFGIA